MAGNVSTGLAEHKGLPYGLDLRIAMEAILLLFVLVVGCGETDDCIQHVNMDINGNVYYTFEGESCGGAVYPPSQTPVMVQFDDSFFANVETRKDGR
jgi:hypothetical protein